MLLFKETLKITLCNNYIEAAQEETRNSIYSLCDYKFH